MDNDLLVKLLMQKTVGPFQQHLRLNVRNIHTFTEALEIIYSYIKSRHLTVPRGRIDNHHQGQADVDIGALKGKQGMKGKGYKGCKGTYPRKGKDTRAKECTKEKAKERAKDTKEQEKDKDIFGVATRATGARNALKVKERCQQ